MTPCERCQTALSQLTVHLPGDPALRHVCAGCRTPHDILALSMPVLISGADAGIALDCTTTRLRAVGGNILTSDILDARTEGQRTHIRHVWMNDRQMARGRGEPWEHDLYEFMDMLGEVRRMVTWLRQARTSTLPVIHQQCSRTEPEAITNNRVVCALGQDVTTCSILQSVYATYAREQAGNRGSYADATPEVADITAAEVCAWHIFTTKIPRMAAGDFNPDTSEGYVQDEGDRMYWRTVYEHMAAAGMADEDDDA